MHFSPVLQVQGLRVPPQPPVEIEIHPVGFEIPRGEALSLIGLETGGLSILIDALLGLHRLAEGEVRILGMPARDPRALDRIGAVRRRIGFPTNLTVREVIRLVQAHYSRPVPIDDLLERFSMRDVESRVTGDLSREDLRWLAIALAFSGDPDLLILDHPTVGMDLSWRTQFWEHVREFVRQGGTVLHCTHLMDEADSVADRVFVFRDGKVIAEGPPSMIVDGSQPKRVSFQAEQDPRPSENGLRFEKQGDYWCVDTADPDQVIKELQRQGIEWKNLWMNPGNLESALFRLSRDDEEDEVDDDEG